MGNGEGLKVHCKFDTMVEPVNLKNHSKNRNFHGQDQISRLAKILSYQGWRYAIKVSNQTGMITSGHGRKLAAIHMGLEKVPVVYQDYESIEQEYADVTADNAIASWAELDLSGINGDLGDLGPDFDIDLLGLKNFSLDISGKINEKELDENIKTNTECPSCGYEW